MPTLTIHIDLPAFAAVARFASDEESRPILHGVHVTTDGTLVATDGLAMLAWPHAVRAFTIDADTNKETPADIPADFILAPAKLPAKGDGILELDLSTLAAVSGVARRFVRGKLEQFVWQRIEGPYPNWRQVIPHPDTLNPAIPTPRVNPILFAKFALDRPGKGYPPPHIPTVTPTDPGRAMLITYDALPCVGVLMPISTPKGAPAVTVPSWATLAGGVA
jgi:hypothetical protein